MKFLFIPLFFTIIKNSYSINWTKEFNGISSNEKINLSNGGTISHYKNFGNWKDSLGNYGTQKCYGTILIDPSKRIEDWKMFCEGMDQDRNYFVLEYFRNSDMTAGTGSYIFIDGTGKWQKYIGTKCVYAVSHLKD